MEMMMVTVIGLLSCPLLLEVPTVIVNFEWDYFACSHVIMQVLIDRLASGYKEHVGKTFHLCGSVL